MISDVIIFWYWLALSALLLILELLVPGVYFLWMAMAAMGTGGVLWLFPALDWKIQVLVFSVLSMAIIFLFEIVALKKPIVSDRPLLNRRASQYIGRTFTLEQPIINGIGKIHIDDSVWRVHGQDCPAGNRVRISGVEGTILKVERVG
ncbi:MAG: NfeD family protein [Methylococcus sp.]|nr:NfeD family protein [Methylococcus sp.]